MLRTVIISPDTELAAYLHRVSRRHRTTFRSSELLTAIRPQIDLTRMLRSHAPQAVFVMRRIS